MAAAAPVAGASSGGVSAAALSAAGSIGGGILGGLLDFPIQKSFVVKQSRHQRKWTEMMSNTQYQRARRDLEAAGLNPMLAYTQGGAGYSAYQQAEAPELGMELDVGKAVSSARESIAAKKELQLMDAQIREQEARAGIAEFDRKGAEKYWDMRGSAQIDAIRTGADLNNASSAVAEANKRILDKEEKIRGAEASSAETLEAMRETKFGKGLILLKEVLKSVR